MKLYHFTSRFHVEQVKKEGLTLGMVPLSIDPPRLARGYQWLTTNPERDQEWATQHRVTYDRTEYRITIEVPPEKEHRVMVWTDVGPLLTPGYEELSAFGDPENWRLYHGEIPPEWFVAVEHMDEVPA